MRCHPEVHRAGAVPWCDLVTQPAMGAPHMQTQDPSKPEAGIHQTQPERMSRRPQTGCLYLHGMERP